jgi:predicted Na+-dependent transporter
VVEFTEWTLLGFVLLVTSPTGVAGDVAERRHRGLTSPDDWVNEG